MVTTSTERIPCYVVVFDQVEIIRKSLNFLAEHSDDLELVVIENPSENTPEIGEIVGDLARAGKVARHYLFEENILGSVFSVVLEWERDTVRSRPLVLITEGDVTSSDPDWLEEQIHIVVNNPEVFACGVTLDPVNLPLDAFPNAHEWFLPDRATHDDYHESLGGLQLVLMRGHRLADFVEWLRQNNLPFIDNLLRRYCYETVGMRLARTQRAKALHLTWDLYNDLTHPYTQNKLRPEMWPEWWTRREGSCTLVEH
jgi:hypothetical protein